MQRVTLSLALGLAVLTGCLDDDTNTDTSTSIDTSADAGTDASADTSTDASADTSTDASTDGDTSVQCCPIDPSPSGCMDIGGVSSDAFGCGQTCDFCCSMNWRIEVWNGCDQWMYDYRNPAPGENECCL